MERENNMQPLRVPRRCLGGPLGLLFLALPLAALALPAGPPSPAPQKAAALPVARHFQSTHTGIFGGQHVTYKAVVDEDFITNDAGQRAASIFTTSFLRTDAPSSTPRPVIFAFNGGPGSASLWLEMGFLGPRRIRGVAPTRPQTVPPFQIVDNPDSPLDVADIVLIDPPGTGFSRILPAGNAAEFYDTDADATMTVQVLEHWIRRNNRWNSPRYLLGESYGTIRAAVVARRMSGGPTESGNMDGLSLNGIILLGQAMDMSGSDGSDGKDANLLPTFAATACFHKKIADRCTAADEVAKAQAFVADTYLKDLYAGSSLSAADRTVAVQQFAGLTGLSPDFLQQHNLRISASAFTRGLLQNQGLQLGMYDSRYTLQLTPNGNDPVADDPAMGQYVPGFVAAFNLYNRDELGVSIDETYQAIAFRTVNLTWNYGRGPGKGSDTNYALSLAIAMRRNPHLRLLVGSGYYDMVTPLGSAEYTIHHAGIPLDRTEMRVYPSGHMLYLGTEARQSLARDVRSFLAAGHASQ